MKLVHISDIHINADPIGGSDSVAEFAACLAHVEKRHGNADAIVISGDLTHHGHFHSYVKLREMLAKTPLKPFLMLGNHDHRETFRQIFPEVDTDENGYVQYVRDIAGHCKHVSAGDVCDVDEIHRLRPVTEEGRVQVIFVGGEER